MTVRSLGIIGHGHFGAFAEVLAETYAPHVSVRIHDPRCGQDGKRFFSLAEACQSDLLVLAVPIHAFQGVLEDVLPLVCPDTIIIDVATVKVHTTTLLHEACAEHPSLRFVATHPMFGPFSYEKQGNSLADLRVVVTDHNLTEDIHEALMQLLARVGIVVLTMSADEHDRMLAETLFLTHYVGQIVHRGGFERTTIDSVSFGFLMDAVESVRQDAALFHDVYHFNPFCREVVERFAAAERDVAALLASG